MHFLRSAEPEKIHFSYLKVKNYKSTFRSSEELQYLENIAKRTKAHLAVPNKIPTPCSNVYREEIKGYLHARELRRYIGCCCLKDAPHSTIIPYRDKYQTRVIR
ncbi:unnamed protein product [Choristocarpus tenellus]